MTMDIALAFRDVDGGYTRHVGAMLASVLACTARSMRLHVLHDATLTSAGRGALSGMAREAGQEIFFHSVDPHERLPGVNENSDVLRPLTFATLYRLFIPSLPGMKNCERVIYLDTDLIVETDLAELWDMDLGQALLGATPDPCICGALTRTEGPRVEWARDVARFSLRLGIPTARYFNAGVLLLRLDAIRERKLFEEAARIVLNTPALLLPDQDALNKVFFEHSKMIPKKFNYILHSDPVLDLQEGVWHYSGENKPWKSKNMPKADRYRHFLRRSPWGEKDAV